MSSSEFEPWLPLEEISGFRPRNPPRRSPRMTELLYLVSVVPPWVRCCSWLASRAPVPLLAALFLSWPVAVLFPPRRSAAGLRCLCLFAAGAFSAPGRPRSSVVCPALRCFW
ncbi:hypothetical protein CSUI_006672 [Cystoisospora suis]|uniref:Uncharacterized protein n=1 Tax=Cystoisospora suis TaxID=483139 RepID=A0A2C6KG86_9APIC|nr:hypothetical protein CSUI_006672 [Cystoisospora suis]